MAAAKEAYLFLEQNKLLFSLKDEVGEPSLERAINQLQELYQRGYMTAPQYTFDMGYDASGNAVFECRCRVESLSHEICTEKCSSKKQAKKEAAYQMMLYYLEEGAV